MRKRAPSASDIGWNSTYEIAVPFGYCVQILNLAHNNVLSGHLGITKTY